MTDNAGSQSDKPNRRTFLTQSARAAAAISLAGQAALAADHSADEAKALAKPAKGKVRLGGPSFSDAQDPDELARAHRELNYRGAYCPQVSLDDKERIRDIREAFARHDVVIAEVGRWCNLLDADPATRKQNLDNVTEGLALADEVGALCCVNIAGSYNPDVWYGPHPDNVSPRFFDAIVENARNIIDAVKPKRARFTYEMMGWALPDSVESYIKLIKAVDRPGFAVHLDPCNLINSPRRFYDTTTLINECFDKLGEWVVSCHAKDLKWEIEMSIHFVEVPVGEGKIDYKTYLKRLAQLDDRVPLMLEHCPDKAAYDRARKHILELGPTVGVSFE
jgi:sugar phosphate isomerase/epimerase